MVTSTLENIKQRGRNGRNGIRVQTPSCSRESLEKRRNGAPNRIALSRGIEAGLIPVEGGGATGHWWLSTKRTAFRQMGIEDIGNGCGNGSK